ncbi:MAG: prolyl oligopeptidase family serine peptidase [Chloroflexales bacterium]|nr:prolyl oligopeptidase family serine peptidase [Chloroflexales bacterium]
MRYPTIVGLMMALALLAGALPAQAQGGSPAVMDEGNNIYLVDGAKGPIPNLLPAEEVHKIRELVFSTPGSLHRVVSPVSPDDQAVLVKSRTTDFLNVNDGSTVRFNADPGWQPLSNYFWLDSDTIAQYAVYAGDESSMPYLLTGDRRSGASDATPVGLEAGFPVLVSPNGRRVLYATLPAETQSAARASAIAELAQAFDPLAQGGIGAIMLFSNLVVRDRETGESRPVATLTPGTRVEHAAFSQDGSMFALTAQLFPTDTRKPYDGALFSDLFYRDATGNLPPAENPFFSNNQLISFDFGSGQAQTLRALDGDGVVYSSVSWSSDNQTLLVKVDQPGRVVGRRYPQYNPQYRAGSSIRFYNRGLQEIRRLERIELSDIELEAAFLSPDEVLIQSQYRLDRRPWYYNLRSGELRDLAGSAGSYRNVTPTNSSRQLIFSYSSVSEAPDYYRMSWDGGALKRLTWANAALTERTNIKQQPLSFTLRDGTTHTGVLVMPGDAPFPPKNLPIVVYQEGGPTGPIKNQWYASVESPFSLLPSFGFGLLIVPLYGRYGIGPERFDGLVDGTNFGQIDIDAQAEIVAQLRARGWANKVGIVGCSYGGYFVNQSITRHPSTYDAAHAQCSLIDLFTEWSRGYPALAPWFEGLPPQAALEEYRRDSPAYNAGRVRTPLLAFHGTDDFLPVTVMENYMLQVINNQVPARLLKFQGAGHGVNVNGDGVIGRYAADYEVYGAQEQITWFRTYLMGQ